MAPGVVKLLYSVCIWWGIAIFPYGLIGNNDFSIWVNRLLKVLLAMTLLQILRSVFNTDVALKAISNKWITMFGNEYCAMMMLPPLFVYIGTSSRYIPLLKDVTYKYLWLGLCLSVFMKYPLGMLTTFVFTLYPFVSKKYRLLIIIAFLEAFIKSVTGENPTRMYLVIIAFAIVSYILVCIIEKLKYIKIFAISVIITPILFFVPTLMLTPGEASMFQNIQEYILDESGKEDLANDTRTFLYAEMAEDLSDTDSWLIGKGAYSRYYSMFFDQSSEGRWGRISSEVPFLTHLLKGGICYVFVYYGLLVYAIYLGIWKGRNSFVQMIACMALCWYFNSFVGDITGCRFYHFAFFMLLGCCLSSKWLNYSDSEVKKIFRL